MMNANVLHACVDEMYPMEKGVLIARPDEIILQCGDGYMTRRQIKHIIEQRKTDNQSTEEIKQMLDRLPYVILNSDFEAPNNNPKYKDSIIRLKAFKSWERAIVAIMDAPIKGKRAIITTYPYRAISAYFLLLKKLHASAAGEAPHPKVIPED